MFAALIPVLTIIHFVAILSICLYGFHRLWLICCLYSPQKSEKAIPAPYAPPEDFPFVTVQLPLYNE